MATYLTADQVASAASSAGFIGDGLVTMIAIAYAESTFNPNAVNGPYIGLWQVGGYHVPSPSRLFDPYYNAQIAYKLSGGSDFGPWQTYTQGTYKKYLTLARDAAGRHLRNTYPTVEATINGVPVQAISVPQYSTDDTYISASSLKQLGLSYGTEPSNILTFENGLLKVSAIVYRGDYWVYWKDIPGIGHPVMTATGGWRFSDGSLAMAAVLAASIVVLKMTAV